jgi:hypothetical protein
MMMMMMMMLGTSQNCRRQNGVTQRDQYSYPRNTRHHRTKCSRPGVLAPGIGHPWLKPLSQGTDCTADASYANVERGDHDKPSMFRHVKAERDTSQTIRSSWNSRSRYPLTILSIRSSILSFRLRWKWDFSIWTHKEISVCWDLCRNQVSYT